MGLCLSMPDDDCWFGVHEFMIRDYSRTKGIGVGKSIVSRCFSIDGRRWRIRFYPDGRNAADSACVALYVETLWRPRFRSSEAIFTAEFQLLGPNGDVRDRTRPSWVYRGYNALGGSWGFPRYMTREKLEGAIHGDSIIVRCIVKVYRFRKRTTAVAGQDHVKMPSPPVSNHADNAIRFLAGGKAPFDVRFRVDGEALEAHRMVVAAQSPWFEGLLYCQGGEAGKKDTLDVGVGGMVTAEAFRGVLHFMYTDELPREVETTKGKEAYDVTLRLLEAADYYLMDRLKLKCASRLRDFVEESTVHTLVELAVAYSCKELEQACRSFAARKRLKLHPNMENVQNLLRRRSMSSGSDGPASVAASIMDAVEASGG